MNQGAQYDPNSVNDKPGRFPTLIRYTNQTKPNQNKLSQYGQYQVTTYKKVKQCKLS